MCGWIGYGFVVVCFLGVVYVVYFLGVVCFWVVVVVWWFYVCVGCDVYVCVGCDVYVCVVGVECMGVDLVLWLMVWVVLFGGYLCVDEWKDTVKTVTNKDFIYIDPPYFGRHTDYFNQWSESDSEELIQFLKKLPCKFAYSTWKENVYRKNDQLTKHWGNYKIITFPHFYHVGATQKLRNKMEEALIINY